ncbi:MAG: glutamate--tRNA ligase [Candidatus Dadabacteria bacterium]|nr:glutamate--tRNA ligase [Candidatus Dadabacteria bacterium]MCY4261834.1 glutamate--tRNA ligase [Candidatus Dadabacteria bacterium]
MKIVTRFAPSPTGALHVGAARTAIFNWLFSESLGGDFLLRIEDTDRVRSEERFELQIIESLKWLGLEWRGEIIRQSGRLDIYGRLAERLIDEKKAYRCYVTAEELGQKREEASKKGEIFRYRREWSQIGAAPGKPYAIRLSVSLGEKIFVEDLVRGEIIFDSSEIEDFVILKADGFPTYNFAAAVDDAQMEISHVIRGDDHIINAPRQILIAEALGLGKPQLAHVPMILGQDGKKLSKRHGAESVTEYRLCGYLPEAVLNYLVRLGWSFGDQEIFTAKELVEKFSLKGIGKSPSVFDSGKFLWLNGKYLRDLPEERILDEMAAIVVQKGLPLQSPQKLRKIMEQMLQRSETLNAMVDQALYFFIDDFEYDEQAAAKFLVEKNREILELLAEELLGFKNFSHDNIHGGFERVMQQTGVGLGKIAQPARVALTGSTKSPGIFDVVEILGKDTVARRITRALDFIGSRGA